MAATYVLALDALETLFAALQRDGRRIVAPVAADGRIDLRPVRHAAEVSTGHVQSVMSAKDVVFPKVERLLSYTLTPGAVNLKDEPVNAAPTVVFGVRPCEGAAVAALDAVFNWDSRDKFFNERLAQLTVIGVACTQADAACFCTSVGGGPADTRGSDILLTSCETGYVAQVLTPKGEAIVALVPDLFKVISGAMPATKPLAEVPVAFDQAALTAKLPAMFDHDEWVAQSLRCVGCGACAFVCPTCVCFDIQEEADPKQGQRLRCWDSCGSRMFTLHASGHNPRSLQSQRWRQRVYHKFSYYPDRYNMLGCVGCGKCTRACPVDMNLREHLAHAAEVRQ
jgi:formate hydrogenlyase subunit 6/NADH:ubiquinone oxidoreductase subunit I